MSEDSLILMKKPKQEAKEVQTEFFDNLMNEIVKSFDINKISH